MADNSRLLIEVSVQGGEVAVRQLGKVGAATKGTAKEAESAAKSHGMLAKSLDSVKAYAGMAIGAGGIMGLTMAFKTAFSAARDYTKIQNQTNAVIKSTHGAANMSAEDFKKLSDQVSSYSGINADNVQSMENVLATFPAVRNEVGKGNDIFNQGTKAITDMSVALKMPMKNAAIMVGKALQDPISGLSAMRRVGVDFTAQQTKMVAGWVKQGDTLKAQKFIIGELNKEFKGSAAAQADPIQKLSATWHNLMTTLGVALLPTVNKVVSAFATFISGMIDGEGAGGKFVGVLKGMVGTVKDSVNWFKQHKTVAEALGFAILAVGGYMTGAALATKLFAASEGEASLAATALEAVLDALGIGLIIAAVAALAFGILELIKHFGAVKSAVKSAFGTVESVIGGAWHIIEGGLTATINFFKNHWKLIASIMTGPVGAAIIYITTHFNQIKHIVSEIGGWFRSAFNTAKSVVTSAVNAIGREVGKVGDWFNNAFTNALHFVQTIAGKIWSFLNGHLFTPLHNMEAKIYQWFHDAFWRALAFIETIPQKIVTAFSRLGSDIGRIIVNGIKGALGGLGKIGHAALSAVGLGATGGLVNAMGRIGGNPLKRFATGGIIPGYGSSDSVPALLAPGEFVVNKQAVKSLGVGTLNALNSGSDVARGGGAGDYVPIQIINKLDSRVLSESTAMYTLRRKRRT